MSSLSNQQINSSFSGLLQVPGGITSSLQTVQDGNGNPTGLAISSTAISGATASNFVPSINGTQISGSIQRLINDGFGDYVSVKDFGAIGDGVHDDTAAINLAISSITKGTIWFPAGNYKITSTITITKSAMHLIGEGSEATIITNASASDAIVYGDGVSEIIGAKIAGMLIQGSNSSGIGFYGKIFASGCELNDLYVNSGSIGVKLDNCWSLRLWNVRVRSAVSDGIQANTNTHNTVLDACKIQVCGGHGLYVSGCLDFVVQNSNFEFNNKDQIHIETARGMTVSGTYMEGIMPTSSGYAGIQVVDVDTLNVINNFFDATQTASGRNGTGTFLRCTGIGGARVTYKDNGFASIASSQTFINFGPLLYGSRAYVPYGSTYINTSNSCRVYNEEINEIGVSYYQNASQTLTAGAWTTVSFNTLGYDGKSEFNTSTNVFVPKDYGIYTFVVNVGVSSLGAAGVIQVRLYSVTDSYEISRFQVYPSGTGSSPIVQAVFNELLTKGTSYSIQLYLTDSTNRTTIYGQSTQRLTIKRVQ